MKILVLSDSHSGASFMRQCVEAVRPDALVHLGDYYDDAAMLHEEFPRIPMYQVPGNCDRFRCPPGTHEILCLDVCGARLYMTHGHRHNVKLYLDSLVYEARKSGAKAALYGHTHVADCHREEDGLWVLNPGSCGSWGGTAAIMEVENGKILACYLIGQEDLEAMK